MAGSLLCVACALEKVAGERESTNDAAFILGGNTVCVEHMEKEATNYKDFVDSQQQETEGVGMPGPDDLDGTPVEVSGDEASMFGEYRKQKGGL